MILERFWYKLSINYYSVKFIFIIILFVFISCQKEKHEDSELASANLVATDTLVFEAPKEKIQLLDKNENHYLGVNNEKSRLYLFNEDGNISLVIDKKGGGPEEYTNIKKAAFWGDSLLAVIERGAISIYDLEGNFLSKCKGLQEHYLASHVPFASSRDSTGEIIFAAFHPSNSTSDLSYFRNKENFNFVKFDPQECAATGFAPYEQTSAYTREYYPNMLRGIFDIDKEENTLVAIYILDDNIYWYDLDSLKLVRETKIEYDHFTTVKGVSPEEDGLITQLRMLQVNSKNTQLKVAPGGEIITRYVQGIPEEKVVKSLVAYNNSPRGKAFIALFDKEGRKLCRDIEFDFYKFILKFLNTQNILFYATEIEDSDGEAKEGLFVFNFKIEFSND